MSVLVVDYGAGNLGSVQRAFEECGADVFVSDSADACADASHIVLPGVGAFADGMSQLRKAGWVDALHHAVKDEGVPLLGICLGMQLLAEVGHEGGQTEGLGFVPGEVVRLSPASSQERIPHVGWNEVEPSGDATPFADIPPGTDFYFVHSYHFVAAPEHVIAQTPYCGGFTSGVQCGTAYGVQFHPEKSSRGGFRLITNFLSL